MSDWESKWNRIKDGVDELKLDTPELIRKYAGVPGSNSKHTGYNNPGTDPEFIWKNLPDRLKRVDTWDWQTFCLFRDKGIGTGQSTSAKSHGLPGGFWFSTLKEKMYDHPFRSKKPGTIDVRILFSKHILDPKRTYWDGEAGGDETDLERFGPWDTKHMTEFWYNGTIKLQNCQIVIISPNKHRGKELPLNCTEEQFKAFAFPEIKVPDVCPICKKPLTALGKERFYWYKMCPNCYCRKRGWSPFEKVE